MALSDADRDDLDAAAVKLLHLPEAAARDALISVIIAYRKRAMTIPGWIEFVRSWQPPGSAFAQEIDRLNLLA